MLLKRLLENPQKEVKVAWARPQFILIGWSRDIRGKVGEDTTATCSVAGFGKRGLNATRDAFNPVQRT